MSLHLSNEDIDDEGRGIGPELGCLFCHSTTVTRFALTQTYLLAALDCGECLEGLVDVWV